MQSLGTTGDLMLRHIANISQYIKSKYNKRVLAWHDMLEKTDSFTMKKYKLDQLVEPVIWAYPENLDAFVPESLWQTFSTAFTYAWGASAYKG